MADFIIKKLLYDLSSHAGLAFVGKYLKRVNVNALIDAMFPVRSAKSEILKSYWAWVRVTRPLRCLSVITLNCALRCDAVPSKLLPSLKSIESVGNKRQE
jgi:hypothetical protein